MKFQRSLWEGWHFAATILLEDTWVDVPGPLDKPAFKAKFDFKSSRWEIFGRKVFSMPVVAKLRVPSEYAKNPGVESGSLIGLILESTGVVNGQFRRIGWLDIEDDAYARVWEAFVA
jgi:hypothetical protein